MKLRYFVVLMLMSKRLLISGSTNSQLKYKAFRYALKVLYVCVYAYLKAPKGVFFFGFALPASASACYVLVLVHVTC